MVPTVRRRNSIEPWNSPELRPLESSLHVFDIDPADSARTVWEEIEQRTKEQVDKLSDVDDQAVADETQPPYRDSLLSSKEAVSPQARSDDDFAERSDESRHLRAVETRAKIESWRAKRAIRRNRLFSQGERPVFYDPVSTRSATRMKLADVLNDVEPELAAEETWPLLKKSRSHFLTAEGKRQVRLSSFWCQARQRQSPNSHEQAKEAGIKLRQRLANTSSTGIRDLLVATADRNRWASYSSGTGAEPITKTKPNPSYMEPKILPDKDSVDKNQTCQLPPLLPSLRVNTNGTLHADGYREESLFESFRAELAKLGQSPSEHKPNPVTNSGDGPGPQLKHEGSVASVKKDGFEKPLPQAPPPYTQGSTSPTLKKQDSQSTLVIDPRSVQVSVSKMLMKTLASISTSMSQLNSEIQHDVMPELARLESLATEGSKDHAAMKHSLKCFEEEVLRIVELLDLVQTKSETFPTGPGRLNLFNMTTAASTVKSFGEAINRLHKSLYSTCDPTEDDIVCPAPKVSKGDQSGAWRFMIRPVCIVLARTRQCFFIAANTCADTEMGRLQRGARLCLKDVERRLSPRTCHTRCPHQHGLARRFNGGFFRSFWGTRRTQG